MLVVDKAECAQIRSGSIECRASIQASASCERRDVAEDYSAVQRRVYIVVWRRGEGERGAITRW